AKPVAVPVRLSHEGEGRRSRSAGDPAMSSQPTWVPRKRRGAEFFLTILAVLIGIGAYCAVGLGVKGSIPAGVVKLALALIAFAVIAHVLVRRVAPYADPVLLPLVLCLNGLGLAMIYRLDLGRT